MQAVHAASGFAAFWQLAVLTAAPALQQFRAQSEMVEKVHLPSQLDWSAWPANYATVLSSLLQPLQMQNIPDV